MKSIIIVRRVLNILKYVDHHIFYINDIFRKYDTLILNFNKFEFI